MTRARVILTAAGAACIAAAALYAARRKPAAAPEAAPQPPPLMTEVKRRRNDAILFGLRSLDDLTGPDSGTVTLPVHLCWQPRRTFDLSDHEQVVEMYLNLFDAGGADDLARYVSGRLLPGVWHDLYLPRQQRWPWEDRFPVLAGVWTEAA